MNPNPWPLNVGRVLVVASAMLMLTANASAEWKEKVLYSFQGIPDGATPAGGVIFDKQGNLYGATSDGGYACLPQGCGTVFEVSPPTQKAGAWSETTIYTFQGAFGGSSDGLTPVGGVIIDLQGNLYGTTAYGGSGPCILLGSKVGCGMVYELSPPTQKGGQWTETILYNFQGGNDGDFPWGDLIFDKHGNLYGATQFGGGQGNTCNQYFGGNCGTVFKVSPPKQQGGTWTEEILHSYGGGADGANPNGDLILDGNGDIYGLTNAGGNQDCNYGSGQVGCGTAFKLNPPKKKGSTWSEQLLHRFDRTNSDGGNPVAGLLLDSKGNLYGTTLNGGQGPGGIVFRLAPPSSKFDRWKETILHSFSAYDEGGYDPECSLVVDQAGRLYGTTNVGKGGTLRGGVFRLAPPSRKGGAWIPSVLHGFTGVPDGMFPATNVIFDKHGNLYSTTLQGGAGTGCSGGCGTVFEVSP